MLKNFTLHNFRRYELAQFQFHPQFTVLIGNNGAGKTTILDGLAMMLNTYFQGAKLATGGGTIKPDDARYILTIKEGQVFRERRDDVYLEAVARLDDVEVTWRRDIGDRGGKAKELVRLGIKGRDQIKDGGSPDLPLLLYYGAGRLWNVHDDVETEKPSSQLDAYRYCLDPKSDHKAFEKWFKKLAYSELQKRTPIPAMAAVKNAVLVCIPGAQDFFHDTDQDQLTIRLEKEGLVPFNSLSDGYRNMVGMVADIAHRASRLNPHMGADAPLLTKGVVLVDEMDLHLHPKWQRRVVSDLKRAFPSIQFIGTTHSPFILQSLEPGEVIDLDQPSGFSNMNVDFSSAGVAIPGPSQNYSNRSIEDIVEGVMGVPIPQRSERYQRMYDTAKEYYAMLEEAKHADEATRQKLKEKLDALSAPFSSNVAYHAFLEMERLAARLGKSANQEGE